MALPPDRRLFDLPDRTAEKIRADPAAAGVEYETTGGVIDFHALRGTDISHLVASGAAAKVCQKWARHSTAGLTIGVYAKGTDQATADAVNAMPDLSVDRPPESDRKTASRPSLAHALPTGGSRRVSSMRKQSSRIPNRLTSRKPLPRLPMSYGVFPSPIPAVGFEPTQG